MYSGESIKYKVKDETPLQFPLERQHLGLAADIRLQVDRILSHELFSRSKRLSQLFRFAVEKSLAGEAHTLKEYTIGVDVFGRPEAFDCRMDSIVRVEASRLRRKLKMFYETAGRNDRLVITMPPSGYTLLLTICNSSSHTLSSMPSVGFLDCRKSITDNLAGAPLQLPNGGKVAHLSYASLSEVHHVFDFIVVCVDPNLENAERQQMIEAALAKSLGIAIISDGRCLDILSSWSDKLRTAWNLMSPTGHWRDAGNAAPRDTESRPHLVA